MTTDMLLAKLAARPVAKNRWRADCPVCGGKSRSKVSIGETDDGVVLLKCFGGCSAADVVHAIGLELHDLFPHAGSCGEHANRPLRRPRVDWAALIAVCERDLLLVKIVLATLGRREPIADVDALACDTAATRVFTLIQEARHG